MEIISEITNLIKDGGQIAVFGFGIFLAYKLTMTWMISYSLIKIVTKILESFYAKKIELDKNT